MSYRGGQEREALEEILRTATGAEYAHQSPNLVNQRMEEIGELARAALAAREESEGDDVEIVARHLAEREHGGPLLSLGPVCEGYKDEARVLLSRLSAARGDTEPRTMRLSDIVPAGTSVSDAVSIIERGMGDDAYRGPREDTERPDEEREEMLDRLERGGDIDD